MVPTAKDICSLIEETAPIGLAEKWDNVGLQAGSLSRETRKILFALDPSGEAIERAYSLGAGLLITHHPLIFSPLTSFDLDSFPAELLAKALERRITVVSHHTNLDRAARGINHALAQLLELKDASVLEKAEGFQGCGLGRIGSLSAPTRLSDFAAFVSERLNAEDIRIVGGGGRRISKAAVVGGSGGGFVQAAHAAGADVLVTGDVGYHHALEAERRGLAVIDAGHFNTEEAAFRVWAGGLDTEFKERGWQVEVAFFEDQHSPFLYIKGGRGERGHSRTGLIP